MMGALQDLSVAVGLLVGLIGAGYAWVMTRREERRRWTLERVERQIRELYGPVVALIDAKQALWAAFSSNYRPAHGSAAYWTDDLPLSEAEKEVWRRWMRDVFMPTNLRLEALILGHMDLFESDTLPVHAVRLLEHVGAYRVVLQQWQDGNFERHISVINYPEEFDAAMRAHYQALRLRQKRLLGLGDAAGV